MTIRNSVPTGFGALPIALDNGHIYSFPDYMGSSKAELKLYKMGPNNKLVLQGTMGIPEGAAACNVVELNKTVRKHISVVRGSVW